MKRFLYGMLIAGFLAQIAAGAPADAQRPAAPDFSVTGLDGQTLQLSALKGNVVLLDFWATWCPPCRAEIPHFKELYTEYKGQGLEVIGLALDREGAEIVRPFAQQNGINYPIAIGGPKEAAAYGGIRGIPTTFLIDKQGRIARKYVGYQDKQVFEQEIRRLLAE